MEQLYFLRIDDLEKGPYSLGYLRRSLSKGEICETTPSKQAGAEHWVPLKVVLDAAPAPRRIVGAAMPDLSKPLPPPIRPDTPPLRKVLNENFKGYNIFSANLAAFKKYFKFSARSTRSEFWYYYLTQFAINKLLGLLLMYSYTSDNPDAVPVYTTLIILHILVTAIPCLSISVRRLHDINQSGWFVLLPLADIAFGTLPSIYAPFISGLWFGPAQIALLVMHCFDSKPGVNKWAKSEKYQ